MTYCLSQNLIIVIDEKDPRNIIINNIECLKKFLTGTIGLIVDSVQKHKILNKETAIDILDKIERSNFRVSKKIIHSAKIKLGAK